MNSGYLYLETSLSHPGLVKIGSSTARQPPDPRSAPLDGDPAIRYIARFNDIDAARMHAHNALRRRLIDVDARTYRTTLEEAIAAVACIELGQRRVFVDPDLDPSAATRIEALIQARRARQARAERLWQIVGGLAIGFLALIAVLNLRG